MDIFDVQLFESLPIIVIDFKLLVDMFIFKIISLRALRRKEGTFGEPTHSLWYYKEMYEPKVT